MAVGFGSRNRNAEIADPHEPVVVDEDVRRLQIAMKHTLRVRRRETRAQLPPDVDDLLRRQRGRRGAAAPRDLRRGSSSIEKKITPCGFADVEDAAHGRVGDLAREPHLAEDPLARGGTRGLDDLQRDLGFEHEIVCAPDISHAAAADSLDHAVPAREYLARREHDLTDRRVDRVGIRRVRGVVELQQRFDLEPQDGILAAGVGQKSVARVERELESRRNRSLAR